MVAAADEAAAPAIVEETPEHRPAVDALLHEAFGGQAEAELVRRLRAERLVLLALVALEAGRPVGTVLFSPLPTELDGRPVRAAALAPLAVRPDRRRRGIGRRLVEAGLARLAGRGVEAVIVLGDPGYYGRFGFSAGLARKLASPFPVDAFMALELVPGTLAGRAGRVTYPAAFGPG